MTYDVKFDWRLVAAIAVTIAVLLLGGNYWICGPVLLILMICTYPQSYCTTEEGLLVRAFCMRMVIPYNVITFVGPGRAGGADRRFMWSANLLAEGITIRYGLNSELHISPARMDAFLTDMAARTPHLVRRGPALVLSFGRAEDRLLSSANF
jgi:hypothetical protein